MVGGDYEEPEEKQSKNEVLELIKDLLRLRQRKKISLNPLCSAVIKSHIGYILRCAFDYTIDGIKSSVMEEKFPVHPNVDR
jgi:hypothetical protein